MRLPEAGEGSGGLGRGVRSWGREGDLGRVVEELGRVLGELGEEWRAGERLVATLAVLQPERRRSCVCCTEGQ